MGNGECYLAVKRSFDSTLVAASLLAAASDTRCSALPPAAAATGARNDADMSTDAHHRNDIDFDGRVALDLNYIKTDLAGWI